MARSLKGDILNNKDNTESTIKKDIQPKTNKKNINNKIKKYYIYIKKYYVFVAKKYDSIYNYFSHIWHKFTDNDRIFHYAASLSFYNIFSIIPAFLMFFSLFSLFPTFQNQIQTLKKIILDNILPDNANEVSNIIDGFLLNGKEMGFVGFLISLISSFIFFRNFDDISARIFIAKKRGYFDSFIIYWLLITLIPMFLATSIYFNTTISNIYSNAVISKLYSFMPILIALLIFSILFRVAANKPLRLFVLLISSAIGAMVWYGLKIGFFYYMTYNKFYSNIYGSVSIIMFAFLWIYVSWLVILFCMQFCKYLDDKYPCNQHID